MNGHQMHGHRTCGVGKDGCSKDGYCIFDHAAHPYLAITRDLIMMMSEWCLLRMTM
jgi:hypothetical protein